MTQLALVEPLSLVPRWSRPVQRGDALFAVRIPVEPHAKERPQSRGKVHFTPAPYRKWLELVGQLLVAHVGADSVPIVEPVFVRIDHVHARPAKEPRVVRLRHGGAALEVPVSWPATRVPYLGTMDVDNAAGATLDALVRARVLFDDRLVVELHALQWWAADGEAPCIEVRLYAGRSTR